MWLKSFCQDHFILNFCNILTYIFVNDWFVLNPSQSPSQIADLFVSFCVFSRSWPPSVRMAVGYATVRRCEMDLSRIPGSRPSGWVCEWEKESPGLYCTLAHMGLPAAAVNVMITLPLQSQLLMGKGHVVFHAFSTHVITHKWQQMMKHTTCKLGIKHFPEGLLFTVFTILNKTC